MVFLGLVGLQKRALAVGIALLVLWLGYAANRSAVLDRPDGRLRSLDLSRPMVVDLLRPPYQVLSPISLRQAGDPSELLSGDCPSEFLVPAVHGARPYLWAPLAHALAITAEGVVRSPLPLRADDQALDILSSRYGVVPRVKPETTYFGRAPVLYHRWLQRPGYRVVAGQANFQVVERPRPLPPVRFVSYASCIDRGGSTARIFRGREHGFGEVALVDCTRQPPPTNLAPREQARATVLREEAGYWLLRSSLPRGFSGLLVISQSDMPGWHASIDSRKTKVHRLYGLVQGVVVPGGRHNVELYYWPKSFERGLYLSGTTMVILTGLALGEALRRRRLAHFSPEGPYDGC